MAHSVVETQIIEAYKVNTSRRTTIIHYCLSTLKSLNVDEEDGNEDTINRKTKKQSNMKSNKKGERSVEQSRCFTLGQRQRRPNKWIEGQALQITGDSIRKTDRAARATK